MLFIAGRTVMGRWHLLYDTVVECSISVKVWSLPKGDSDSFEGPHCDIHHISVSATISAAALELPTLNFGSGAGASLSIRLAELLVVVRVFVGAAVIGVDRFRLPSGRLCFGLVHVTVGKTVIDCLQDVSSYFAML